MVLTHPFKCPTHVINGVGFDEAVAELVGGRRWALVTSPSWLTSGADRRLIDSAGACTVVIGDVKPNPTVSEVYRIARLLPDETEVVVALGGGSVIDAAKGLIAVKQPSIGEGGLMTHLTEGSALEFAAKPQDLIAIPTTSGTGSEVTRWGTIWGDDGIKFSINDPCLYPAAAILDPALCVTMPRELTLATGLDALSHAAESVWNRRHSEISDQLATQAIRVLRRDLATALESPADIGLRSNVQSAALLSGLAMGTTQTALAHSISYPFTSRFGVPHGLACSFTLPVIAAFNGAEDRDRLWPIAEGLGCEPETIPDVLNAWFHEMELTAFLSQYVGIEAVDAFDDQLITRARAANNIRDVDGNVAKDLAREALREFTSGAVSTSTAGD
ncbi:MAG: phosphonoacetaldehyde reductase [Rhodospirillales bacterium]